jgi:hypothetical protein
MEVRLIGATEGMRRCVSIYIRKCREISIGVGCPLHLDGEEGMSSPV